MLFHVNIVVRDTKEVIMELKNKDYKILMDNVKTSNFAFSKIIKEIEERVGYDSNS